MNKFTAKPYKLIGKMQHYDWGTVNNNAYIPRLLGVIVEPGLPFAEYWIGDHPKAPSDIIINDKQQSLVKIISEYPDQILGKRLVNKFGKRMPFLLKLLSIGRALSIQAHPDKKLAEILHQKDPQNYPDDNHKPEIAVALDELKAIVGLKSIIEIKNVFADYPELFELIEKSTSENLRGINSVNDDKLLKQVYSEIMHSGEKKLKECIINLTERIKKKSKLTKEEITFFEQQEIYGFDVGLISLFLFNYIDLKTGEAIFTPAGIPHAYLKGNIIECMANSDNVVRAGLTNKFMDKRTLLDMLVLDNKNTIVKVEDTESEIVYKTPAEEFEIVQLKLNNKIQSVKPEGMSIIFVLNGEVNLFYNKDNVTVTQGEFYLIPAALNKVEVERSAIAKVFLVRVPSQL